ncbi:MAG: protein kinase [Longimicrobiales bacterium]
MTSPCPSDGGVPRVSVERTTCRSCGNALLPTDAFCSGCGIPVRARRLDAGEERRTLIQGAVPTSERRHCGSCNAPLFPGDAFCAACGSTLSASAQPDLPDSGTKLRSLIEEASNGRYRIIREIGRGGMGAVFVAEDSDLSRRVAIKVLSGASRDPATLRRFEREARTVAQLRHDAIVRVHAVGELGELHFFVMDFVEGVSLQRLLVAQGPLPIPMVEAVLYRVAIGLAYAHGQPSPVIHRDVKPSNILVDTDGQVILMDFGVAKVGDESQGLTRTGMIVGTAEYMSPEQIRSLPVTPSTDQYALGAVAFAMLVGRPPFTGAFYEVLIAHQKEPIPDVRSVRPEVPAPLARAVERMLAKDPADRWPDLPTLLRELDLRPLSPYDATTEEMAGLARSLYEGDVARSHTSDVPAPGEATPTGSLRIDLPTERLEVGDSVNPEVAFEMSDGSSRAGDVVWSIEPPGVVRVDPATGELVAVAPGTARITARGQGMDGSVDLTVTPPQVTEVSIRPEGLRLAPGESVQLEAVALTRSGRPLEESRTWASSDPEVVTVSPTGEVRAVRAGSASVVVYCGAGWAATSVAVEEAPVPLEPTDSEIRTPTGKQPAPSPGSSPGPDTGSGAPSVRPSSSDSIVRVSPGTGVVAVLALVLALAGWWAFRPGGDPPAPPTPTRLSVTVGGVVPDGPLVLGPGESALLGLEAPGSEAFDGSAARWASSDPSVVRVEGSRATAVGTGSATIEVALAGAGTSLSVSVRAPWAGLEFRGGDGAALSDPPVVVVEGRSVPVRGVLIDEAGDSVGGPDPVWQSEAPDIARYEAGGVTGIAPGETVLIARAGDVEASLPVRVEERYVPPPGPGTLEIVVTPGFANVFLDGLLVGENRPRYDFPLEAGTYRIRLENPAFMAVERTLTIRPGQTIVLECRLGRERSQCSE